MKALKRQTLNDLVEVGFITKGKADFLRNCLKQRLTVCAAGGAGSGKVTLLQSLLNEVGTDKRIVCCTEKEFIFDMVEKSDTIMLRCGEFDTEEGKITASMNEILWPAIISEPNALIVHPVRGPEILKILFDRRQYRFCCLFSLDCEYADQVIPKILEISEKSGISEENRLRQVNDSLDVVVFCEKNDKDVRSVSEICQLTNGVLSPTVG